LSDWTGRYAGIYLSQTVDEEITNSLFPCISNQWD